MKWASLWLFTIVRVCAPPVLQSLSLPRLVIRSTRRNHVMEVVHVEASGKCTAIFLRVSLCFLRFRVFVKPGYLCEVYILEADT